MVGGEDAHQPPRTFLSGFVGGKTSDFVKTVGNDAPGREHSNVVERDRWFSVWAENATQTENRIYTSRRHPLGLIGDSLW